MPLFFFFSCVLVARCTCTHICSNAIPEANFVNFDSSELHGIIVNEYYQGGTFDKLKGTKIYTNAAMPGPDTLQLYQNSIILDGFTDYIIAIPDAGKTWFIKALTLRRDSKKEDIQCTSGISYYLNDTLHVIAPDYTKMSQPAVITLSK